LKHKRKNYHHGDLKPALIQAGLELLEEQGLEALTLRAIAARVGVSHTAPKNHFDGLLSLLASIAAEGFRRHATEMRKGVEGHSNRADRLRAATEGYVRFARENPALFKLMFSPRLKGLSDPDLIAAGSESYGVLRSIADGLEWARPGPERTPSEESLRTERMLWAFAHGYASLLIEGHGPPQTNGRPELDVLDVMPVFHYRD
jgi:AcrR family transcriptional regulator